MGRVARYKKVRSCDPFAKGGGIMANEWGYGDNGQRTKKRSKTSEKMRAKRQKTEDVVFDMAPTDGDDFDINDMVGSLKKQKEVVLIPKEENKSLKTVKVDLPAKPSAGIVPLSMEEERKDAKILNINMEKKPELDLVAKRMDGESKKAFYKRMKTETKRIIRNEKLQENHNPEKKQRKKDFMNEKRRKKKGKFINTGGSDVDDPKHSDEGDGFDTLITGERAAQHVAFGEQAQRPPEFKILPRGATPKNKNKIQSKPGMSGEQQHAEQRAMESMRAKVQAHYQLLKAKRKRDGDFHL